jgi:hypothetical protein
MGYLLSRAAGQQLAVTCAMKIVSRTARRLRIERRMLASRYHCFSAGALLLSAEVRITSAFDAVDGSSTRHVSAMYVGAV